jgi:hypothetical protein
MGANPGSKTSNAETSNAEASEIGVSGSRRNSSGVSSSKNQEQQQSANQSDFITETDLTKGSLGSSRTQVIEDSEPFEKTARQRLQRITAESIASLSPKAQACILLPELLRQKDVYNSAMVYTKTFDHLVVSRYEHQIHAAAQVAELRAIQELSPGQLQMDPYELDVLELALLFHDFGHVVGSHAMDQVFAAMKSKPDIAKFYGNDFHEFHGAQELGKGPVTDIVREILGRPLFDDVMAVLTFYDTRPHSDKVAVYGDFSPTLDRDSLYIVHQLCDRLDRSSYVALDFSVAGYHDAIVEGALEVTKCFLKTLYVARDRRIVGNISEPDWDPYRDLITSRLHHFEQVPAHPTNGLVGAVLQRAAWQGFEDIHIRDNPQLYDFVREAVFNDPREFFGKELWEQLTNSQALCITDTIAPVVTLDKQDFEPEQGSGKLGYLQPIKDRAEVLSDDVSFPAGLVQSLCDVPLYDASLLELRVRMALKQRGVDMPVYVLISPVLDKSFKITRVVGGEEYTETRRPVDGAEYRGYVVVAAQAIDENGNPRDLSVVQDVVENVIYQSGWLKSGLVIREEYNPRAFVEPLQANVFSEPVRRKMEALHPEWIRRGGSGLIRSSNRLSAANE